MRGTPRSAHINVRVTPEERAAIVARSSSFGMAPSTFMREAALLAGEKPVKVADAEELHALRTDLKRVGNLLNQSLKLAYIHGAEVGEMDRIVCCVSSVSAISERIAGLLARANE